MHDLQGNLTYMPYGVGEQYILSVGRRTLNEELVSEAEKLPNVNFHFSATCKRINLQDTTFEIEDEQSKERSVIKSDLLVGADGSYSIVRDALQRQKGVDMSQSYLAHGYKELVIPARNGEFALEPNALHIWPRGDFMMIALPNPDKSFTVTLFFPWENGFNTLKTEQDVQDFFIKTLPDAVPLMPTLIEDYFKNPTGHLINIHASPWHFNRSVILGDAAHAIVPFYGQGMNCSLEDVDVFDDLLDSHTLETVLPAFFEKRKPAADAISLLSRNNYIEMRSKVASTWFLWRKSLEKYLHKLFPNKFIPLYTMVAFTSIPYHEVIARDEKQTRVLDKILLLLPLSLAIGATFIIPQSRSFVFSTFARSRI